MSTYESSFATVSHDRVDAPTIPAGFIERYPELALLFGGRINAENGRIEIPAATLVLFFEGGRLKFCVKPRSGGRVAFGTVTDASEGLVGVEEAIRVGHFEWKVSGGQKRS